MLKRVLTVLLLMALVVALPLLLRRDTKVADPGSSDDRLVIITPHNDTIRKEFGEAFADYWFDKTGRTIYLDWRAPGGGGEIRRVINGSFAAAEELGKEGAGLDIFFGGGTKDFVAQAKLGHLAELWVFKEHPEWFTDRGVAATFSGETYYDPDHRWLGVCVSQFGIVYNRDVLKWIGVLPPQRWRDLGDFSYFGRLALADPTKSSSVTQAFEMLIQEQMQAVIREQGDSPESRAEGWKRGLNLLQDLAANARYFTDSSSKIPHDVAMGDAGAGTSIDFYGRSFEDAVRKEGEESRLHWISPVGGTSLSVDSIAVFRGAPHMEMAQEFVSFCLSKRGQLLWNLKPGTPGGPKERSLRRLPVRRDLYTPQLLADFRDPLALPYERTGQFVYRPELTGQAFDAIRVIFRAMCMEPHEEMRAAWQRHALAGGAGLERFHEIDPVGYQQVIDDLVPLVTSKDALGISRRMLEVSKYFRENYSKAAQMKGAQP